MPDLYQGTELWDFSLVDPDNRRPVDFYQRARLLTDVKMKESRGAGPLIHDLLANWQNGGLKLFVTYKALNFRKAHLNLFLQGDYIPLEVRGPNREKVVAFARRHENSWAVVVVARLFSTMLATGNLGVDPKVWQGTFVALPQACAAGMVEHFYPTSA